MEVATQPTARPSIEGERSPAETPSLHSLLDSLYQEQLALSPEKVYLLEHSSKECIANQIETFHWYRPYLPKEGTILDWGSQHAPDSCLLRSWFGERFDLYSCDFVAENNYPIFYDYARTTHVLLEDPVQLPYPSNTFDAVIASGVLEHTAKDYESLSQLYRVLKPGGTLVISYLPNWLSLKEWFQRVVRNKDFHRRLYGLTETAQMLKHSGFYPATIGYHTFFWQRLFASFGLGRWQRGLTALFSHLVPVQIGASTLCSIAHKVRIM